MELSYILSVFVLSVLLLSDFVFISCASAVPSCSVRAEPVSAPEVEAGFKCVCKRNFYGKNCRFKARNKSIDADAQWQTNNSAKIAWHGQYGENFHLSVRRIVYLDNGTVIPSKWFQAKITSATMELYGDIPTGVMFKSGTPTQTTAVVSFTQAANYEVYLSKMTSTGDVNGSVSIFLDASDVLVLDEKNISKVNQTNQSNETTKCAWFECPGKYFHVTAIMDDFGKPCFIHGAIVAVLVTILGILLIGTLIYVVLRQCKRMKNEKPNIAESVSEAELSASENVEQSDKDNGTLKSFIIEIPVTPNHDIFTENESCAGSEHLESFVVTVDDIQAVKPPSVHWTDEETLSQSSGSSLTMVTSLSTLGVSSLSEGEIVFPMAHV